MNRITLKLASAALGLLAFQSQGAVTLTNGSFESTGTTYMGVLGGLDEASGWTNLTENSSLLIQASSALADYDFNPEFTSEPGSATGSRYLRLASDGPAYNRGVTAQSLGTMVAGETYTLRGDIFGGPSVGLSYGARISFAQQLSATSTFYATQTVDGVGNGDFGADAFNFSYTATGADDGQELVLLIEALGSAYPECRRGGIDNLRLSTTSAVPEVSSHLALLALGSAGVLTRRRLKRAA